MSSSRLLLAVLLVLPSVRAGIIVVDQNPTLGDFTTLSGAVAAASDGDVLLVHPASYFEGANVIIDNKTLTIVGESTGGLLGAQASLTPGFLIRNLAPGKQVVIENLMLQGAPSTATVPATSGLVLRNNSSHVRVQGCPIHGGGGASNAYPDGAAGVDILDCYSTALIGCIVDGGDGQLSLGFFVPTGDGGPAITNFGGTTHSFDMTSPVRVGQVGQLTLGGQPNETTLIFVSLVLHQIPLPGYEGVLMLSPTNLVGPFVIAPPANQLVPFLAPSISGLESLTLFVQPAYSVAGDVNLGTGRVLTVLDSSF